MIVDAHHHFWNLDRESQPWMTDEHDAIRRTFGPADLEPLLERAGVGTTVLVQAACTDSDTDAMVEHAAERAWIGGVIAWIDLLSPERTRERLDELLRRPKLRGFRHLTHDESDPHWILRDQVLESLAVLEARQLILELPCVFPRHLGDVPELAASFPGLTIVIDHLGKPPLQTDEMGRWAEGLAAAASQPNVAAKISGLNTILASAEWDAGDLRDASRRRGRPLRPRPPRLRQRLAGGAPERRLREGVAGDGARGRGRGAGRRRAPPLGNRAPPLRPRAGPGHDPRGERMTALTDQAIAEIKNLIMSGEFAAASKLPKEQDLARRLGLSRNSLREAVRALTLIGVLEPRVGDGTYVTSLEPELLLTGMGFVSDLLTGPTLLELHQVRRILEPVATGMAASRLDDDDFVALEAFLAEMESAETTQAFIAADEEFHRIIVSASGNSTLASLIQNLSGGTLRARLWRSVREQDAIETTKRRHWDIYRALLDRDAERASAADLIHLSEGEQWLRQLIENEDARAVLSGGDTAE